MCRAVLSRTGRELRGMRGDAVGDESDLDVGVLAVREGRIGPDAFAEACRAWASGRGPTIGAILEGMGLIDPAGRADLERRARPSPATGSPEATIVGPGRGDDPGATLAHPPPPRHAETLVHDPAGRPSPAAATLVLPTASGRSNPGGGAGPPPGGPDAGRYSLLEIHGAGGLGRVWRALDRDLNREVALKELHPEKAGDRDQICQFQLEAQVTGQLEHPNIVPVYELAFRPQDNQPFYTMRFVKGRTFGRAIADYHEMRRAGVAGRLEFPGLLGRFYVICFAVGYAHSRGVIHRDLKPENVMLGEFAEVNVVDWGLARLIKRGDDAEGSSIRLTGDPATIDMSRTGVEGSPAYMAPEQVDERFGPLGPATDVYGLGTILFELLTGRAPHRGETTNQVLGAIVREETPRARSVEPTVPAALDAICAKAMAKDPADRYAKAADLAVDVQRYMNDEPTTAYREPPLARAARWARRHKSWTQAAATALLLVSVVSTLAALIVADARRDEATARRQAEARYFQARGFADTLLAGVSDDLEGVPGAESVRLRLLKKAAEAYQDFAGEKGADPGLRLRSGQAFLRLAEVLNMLHDLPGAVRACRDAQATFEALGRDQPTSLASARGRAESMAYRGRVHNTAGQNPEALLAYREAVDAFNDLDRRAPHDSKTLDRRAACNLGLALVLQETGRPDEAERTYLDSLEDYDHLIHDAESPASHGTARPPGDESGPSPRAWRARCLLNLATLLDGRGRRDEAESRSKAAIADIEALPEDERDATEMLDMLAAGRNNLGLILKDLDRPDEAEAAFTQAVERYETLVYKKAVPKHMNGLVNARMNLANLHATESPEAAEEALRAAVHDAEILARLHPDDPDYLVALGNCWHSLGVLLHGRGRLADAAVALGRGVVSFRRGKAPAHLQSESLFWRARTLLDLKRLDAALPDLEAYPTLRPDDAGDQYAAACFWSRASALAPDATRRAEYAERAVSLLGHALILDPKLAPDAAGDTDLDPIRALPSFKRLPREGGP